jgi:hypothetical protein
VDFYIRKESHDLSEDSGYESSKSTWSPRILPRTQKQDDKDNTRKMDDILAGTVKAIVQSYRKRIYPKDKPKSGSSTIIVDIAAISAIGMHYNLRREENEAFIISLYKIDRILEER